MKVGARRGESRPFAQNVVLAVAGACFLTAQGSSAIGLFGDAWSKGDPAAVTLLKAVSSAPVACAPAVLHNASEAVCGAFSGTLGDFVLLTNKFLENNASYAPRGDYSRLIPDMGGQTFVYKGGVRYAVWYSPGSNTRAVVIVTRETGVEPDTVTWSEVAALSRPRLGVTFGDYDFSDYPVAVLESAPYKIPMLGSMVTKVEKGGPAAEVGLRAATKFTTVRGVAYPINGDIITWVGSELVYGVQDVQREVRSAKPGATLTLTINRTGKTIKVKVKPRVIP